MVKTGIGYDIHRFIKGRRLFLGGVEIPSPKGLLGHSDADVLLHAVCDALLGAASAGDIGEHFPDTDQRYKDISSVELLRRVAVVIKSKKYRINNIDAIVIMEKPKRSNYKKEIQEKISSVLKISADKVSVKAKTHEGLGVIGKGLAVASYCVATIVKGV
ncbi:MAG: 2-C-methyl-D-erythritol 2,4-cyclodiphosphate synthase [Candidatus Omnitrophota bacterium]|jgi:2-C-methyl-D-erythritol 2,4-cyclodiphosphate synthase